MTVAGEKMVEALSAKRAFVMYSELSEDDNKLWLVDGLFGQAESGAVYGQPGSGKSRPG